MDERSLRPTAAIATIGDEIVEGRILNENAKWLADSLMRRGIWPRLVVAIPDDIDLIVRVLRIAADSADVLVVCGGLGFTPDDITRGAVAKAFYREVCLDAEVSAAFTSSAKWASDKVAAVVATFPENAEPILSPVGGVPGFRLGNVYVLPGVPVEMRAMFELLDLPNDAGEIYRTELTASTTEDRIAGLLEQFSARHPEVRLGSYPTSDGGTNGVSLVLVSRSAGSLDAAFGWLRSRLPAAHETR